MKYQTSDDQNDVLRNLEYYQCQRFAAWRSGGNLALPLIRITNV